MRRRIYGSIWTGLLVCVVCIVHDAWAGAGGNRVIEASGTAPVGTYTYPSNFAQGRSIGAGYNVFGSEITREQLTNPETVVSLVVELSYDGGKSWPADCTAPASSCWCHEASTVQPVNTDQCSMRLLGGQDATPALLECTWERVSDTQTRMRGRMLVCGAPATGTISSTWRFAEPQPGVP